MMYNIEECCKKIFHAALAGLILCSSGNANATYRWVKGYSWFRLPLRTIIFLRNFAFSCIPARGNLEFYIMFLSLLSVLNTITVEEPPPDWSLSFSSVTLMEIDCSQQFPTWSHNSSTTSWNSLVSRSKVDSAFFWSLRLLVSKEKIESSIETALIDMLKQALLANILVLKGKKYMNSRYITRKKNIFKIKRRDSTQFKKILILKIKTSKLSE